MVELLYWSQPSQTGRGVFTFSPFDLFQAKLNFNFQFRTYFLQKLVKGICQTLHVIHWTAEACFRLNRTNLVEETDCFFSLAQHWSLIMTRIPLHLSPAAFPVESLLHKFFSASQSSRGLRRSNRDCACLRLSQGFEVGSYPSWAIQPSILAWYRGPSGQGCTRWEKIFGISLFHPNICRGNRGLPSLQ